MKKQTKPSSRIVWRRGSALFAWMAVIFAFSAIHGSSYPYEEPTVWYILERKGAHVFEYALLMLLSVRFFTALYGQESFRRLLFISGAFSFLYAVSDELHQFFVPYRGAKISDVLIDLAGIVLVAGVLLIMEQSARKKDLNPQASKMKKPSRSGKRTTQKKQ